MPSFLEGVCAVLSRAKPRKTTQVLKQPHTPHPLAKAHKHTLLSSFRTIPFFFHEIELSTAPKLSRWSLLCQCIKPRLG